MRHTIAIALLLSTAAAMAADVIVPVYVDGQKAEFTPAARMRAGRTYVPLRAGAQALGATVKWNPQNHQAIVCVGDACKMIKADQGINVDGHILVPLRTMGETLGCSVQWNAQSHAVMIARPKPATFR
jgi:hypothetical protein